MVISDGPNPEAQQLLVTCYLNSAACKLKTGDYKKVIDVCNKVLEKEPKNVKGLFRRGKAYIQINELDKAIEDLNTALQIDVNNVEVRNELKVAKEKIELNKKQDKQFYGNIFGKLKTDEGLYAQPSTEQDPKMKKCGICGEEVEIVQWARHVIKKHGDRPKN